MERGLLAAAGIGMALVGGLFFAYFVGEFASGGNGRTEPPVYAGLIVFFGGMLATGLFLAWRMLRPRPTSSGDARPSAGPSSAGSAGAGPRGRGRSGQGPASPPAPPTSAAERERRVLRLAEQERGRVTVPEVASRCGMTIAEAKTELDRLVLHQVAEIQVTASGVLVYVFPGFLSDSEKARATDF
jgi:hypothetical protein